MAVGTTNQPTISRKSGLVPSVHSRTETQVSVRSAKPKLATRLCRFVSEFAFFLSDKTFKLAPQELRGSWDNESAQDKSRKTGQVPSVHSRGETKVSARPAKPKLAKLFYRFYLEFAFSLSERHV